MAVSILEKSLVHEKNENAFFSKFLQKSISLWVVSFWLKFSKMDDSLTLTNFYEYYEKNAF